jgi:TATA-box binding protein (TBP) (component of TFIID and TFIIIB)
VEPYVFIVFFSGHVNVTGIPGLKDIKHALCSLRRELGLKRVKFKGRKIDTITCSVPLTTSDVFRRINIPSLQDYLEAGGRGRPPFTESAYIRCTFNPERFAGLFIKTRIGTVLIFKSAKCILVGCNSPSRCTTLAGELLAVLNRHERLERLRPPGDGAHVLGGDGPLP